MLPLKKRVESFLGREIEEAELASSVFLVELLTGYKITRRVYIEVAYGATHVPRWVPVENSMEIPYWMPGVKKEYTAGYEEDEIPEMCVAAVDELIRFLEGEPMNPTLMSALREEALRIREEFNESNTTF